MTNKEILTKLFYDDLAIRKTLPTIIKFYTNEYRKNKKHYTS